MNDKVYFITAFWEVDWTDNPVTCQLLMRCGNAFKTEAKAVEFLQMIKRKRDE